VSSFNAGDIEASVTLKRDDFNAALDAVKADAAQFTRDPIKATVTANADQAKTVLDDLTARKAKAGTDVSFTVKATDGASTELARVQAQKDRVGKDVTVNVKTKSDTSGLDDIGKKITELKDGPFNLLTTAIIGLGPAAVPVLGVVTAAVLPLTAALGSAVAGLGAFGVVSKAVLTPAATAATAVYKAQTAYTTALASGTKQAAAYATEQKAIATAYAGMSAQQIALSKQVGDLEAGWRGVLKSVTPVVSSALVPWLKDVQGLLGYIKPLVTPVAALFQQWGTSLGQALSGNSAKIKSFIDGFAGASAGNIRNFGDALVFFAKGAGALIHDIAPNLGGASLGIARLAASFDGWASSKQTAADIQGFFAWVKSEGPEVGKFLQDLATDAGHLVKAMVFTGGGDLTVLTDALGLISKLPPGVIAVLADGYVALSLGLRAASAAMVAWNIVSTIAKGIQAALGDEVKVTGAALAIQKVATLLIAGADAVADAAETVYIGLMLLADAASLPLIAVVGGIVLAIGLLGAGIFELITHWHDVEAVAVTVWHGVLAAVQAVWSWIKGNWPLLLGILLGPVATAAALIYLHWNAVTSVFSGVLDWVTGHWKLILVILTGPVGAAALWIASHWAAITGVFSAVIDWLGDHWKLILVILTGPVGLAALWLIHAWAGIHNDIDIAWNAIAAFFVSWWNAEVAKFTAAGRLLQTVLSAAWSAVSTAAKTAWAAVAAFFTAWWNSEVAAFKAEAAVVGAVLAAAWALVEAGAKAVWGAIAAFFTAWWNSEVAAFRGPVTAITAALAAGWAAVESEAKTVFGRLSAFFSSFWGALKSGFASAVAGVKTAWAAIQGAVEAPVDWVIKNVYDALIVRFWNDVAGPVGLPKLAALAEGGIVPGGYSRTDNKLAWVRSGEGVLQPGAVARLGGPGFIAWANAAFGDVPVSGWHGGGFAAGGVIPGRDAALGDVPVSGPALGPLTGLANDVTGFLGTLVSDVANGIYSALASAGGAVIGGAAKLIPGSSGVADAMRAYPLKLWDAFAGWVTGHGPGPATGGHSSVPARSGSALAAQNFARSLLASYGWAASQMTSLLALWNQESGWNDEAVNPSSGAYGIPQALGKGHPYNLGDYANQVVWGLNYISGRYGSPAAAEAHEQEFNWYDTGGWLQPGATMVMNGTGRPEPVLSGAQWDALTSAASGGGDLGGKLDRIAGLLAAGPRATASGLGDVLNGTARTASHRGRYPKNS
jgi:hypothetical protein